MTFIRIVKSLQKHFLTLPQPPGKTTLNYSPVFFVCPPRSGSTIIADYLITNFHCGYISNIMALFPSQMHLIARALLKQHKSYQTKSQSVYGFVNGICAPNEAGAICEAWLSDSGSQTADSVIFQISRVSNIFDAPIVIKNTLNSARIDSILEIFPSARFVRINRSVLDISASILRARISIHGSEEAWWGIKPLGYEATLESPPEDQVAWQVAQTIKQIDKAQRAHPEQFFSISYEQFIGQPENTLNQLASELGLKHKDKQNSYKVKKNNSNTPMYSDTLVQALEKESLL